jgi:amino-acid N-acetyltransferase
VLDNRGRLLSQLTVKQAKELVQVPAPLGDDVQIYLPHAIKACDNGVKRSHLISRKVDGGTSSSSSSRTMGSAR